MMMTRWMDGRRMLATPRRSPLFSSCSSLRRARVPAAYSCSRHQQLRRPATTTSSASSSSTILRSRCKSSSSLSFHRHGRYHHHGRNSSHNRRRSFNTTSASAVEVVPEPTYAELRAVAIATGVPFVGFGFMDNALLIIFGDAIDTTLGVWIGISTMCAAAIGNIVSDIAGIIFGAAIEDFCAKYMKLPAPNLTAAQRQLRSVRFASQWGTGVGMVIGCIIGMFPLLYIDSNKVQALKREAHMDSIFRDVVTEAASLIGAQRTCLFVLVHKDDNNSSKNNKTKNKHPVPTPDGKYLYAKYDAVTALNNTGRTATTTTTPQVSDRYIPLGRGIVSRAALTGESWNIYSVDTEPEFVAERGGHDSNDQLQDPSLKISNMVCVPVLDTQGRAIAVIQAINKISKGSIGGEDGVNGDDETGSGTSSSSSLPLLSPKRVCFTNNDVQVLKALASHISVKLQLMYEDLGGKDSKEHQLKDTIRMLKEYGLEGVMLDNKEKQQRSGHHMLFPED